MSSLSKAPQGSLSKTAIVVQNLVKKYKQLLPRKPGEGFLKSFLKPNCQEIEAVDSISFQINKGERVAFIGPNGAGKSTTIKILTGILHPTSGMVEVLGIVPWKDRPTLSYEIGTVFGQRSQLWYHLPAGETFDLYAKVYDLSQSDYIDRKKDLVRIFDLQGLLSKPVKQLSLGERMRCEIAVSMLHRPKVLLLDEPSIGLDVTAKAAIRDLIKDQSLKEGTTLLLTSHDTGDMEQVCDRVIVINHGKLLLDSPISSLRQSYIREKIITLKTADEAMPISYPGLAVEEVQTHSLKLRIKSEEVSIEEVIKLALKTNKLRDLTVEDPPLEDIIKKVYQDAKIK